MATQKSKPTPAPIVLKCDDVEWREGHRRALAMFRDLRDLDSTETDCNPEWRDGRPQENVVYGHLLGVLSTKNDGVLAAFSSVLTHYIGNSENCGGVPDIDGNDGMNMTDEMRTPVRMQIGRPSRAKISMKSFAEVANG